MKTIFFITTVFVLILHAEEDMNRYSYEYQKNHYEQAKGDQQQKQHRYRKGDQSGDGLQKQHRYGQNGNQHKGGGRH